MCISGSLSPIAGVPRVDAREKKLSRVCRQRLSRRARVAEDVNGVVASVNWLAGADDLKTGLDDGFFKGGFLDDAHSLVEARRQDIAANPFSEQEAARALLHSSEPGYECLEPGVGELSPFVQSQVSLPEDVSGAPRLRSLLDPVGRNFVEGFESLMINSKEEQGRVDALSEPPTLYHDPVLKQNPLKYGAFVRDLKPTGLVRLVRKSEGLVPSFLWARRATDCG